MIFNKTKRVELDLSLMFFIKVGVFIIILIFFNKILGILTLLYVSFIFASAIRPLVNMVYKIFKHKVSYSLCTILVYIIIVLFWVFAGLTFLTPIINQFINLIDNIPDYILKITELIDDWRQGSPMIDRLIPEVNLASVMEFIQTINFSQLTIAGTVNGAKWLMGAFPSFLYLLLFSWYFLNDRDKIVEFLLRFFVKADKRESAKEVLFDIETKLGQWMQGQLLLMFIIGFLSFLGLSLLGIKFAVPLGIIAGMLEVIPTLGPILSVVPAFVVALVYKGWTFALLVIFLYLFIQQLENNLIVPRIMQIVVGIHALLIILGIMIGQALAGGLGAILAVPTLVILKILFKDHLEFEYDKKTAKK